MTSLKGQKGGVGYPTLLAQHAGASADALLAKAKVDALPVAGSSNSLSPLAALDMASGLCDDMASSLNDDLAHRPMKPQAMTLDIPNDDDHRDLDDWCSTDNVSLPTAPLPASDGSIQVLTDNEQQELSEHLRSGHVTKSNLCPGCLVVRGSKKDS